MATWDQIAMVLDGRFNTAVLSPRLVAVELQFPDGPLRTTYVSSGEDHQDAL